MSHLLKKLADGSWVRADDTDDVVADGVTLRTPFVMMDGHKAKGLDAEHRRSRHGYMDQADADRVVDARDKYIKRQGDAWRSPPNQSLADREPVFESRRPQPMQPMPQPVADHQADQPSPAWRAYCQRLEDGYRHAKSHFPGRIN